MGSAKPSRPKLVPHSNLVPFEDRIKWTAEQIDLLANAMIKQCGIESSYDVMPIHYQKVEHLLPKDQRRTIVARAALSRVIKRIAAILGEDDTAPASFSKVFWTSHELRKLARALIEKCGIKSKDEVTILFYHQVKDVLEPDRQRNIKQLHQLKEVMDEVPNMLRAIATEKEEAERAHQEELRKKLEEESQKFTITLRRDEGVLKLGAIVDLLLETLSAQIAERFTAHMHRELSGINDTEIARFLGMKSAKPVHKTRVAIAGLLSEQNTIIERDFGKLLDLRLIAKDAPHQSVQDKIKSCEYVIGMTKFISHSLDGTLAKHHRYMRHDGGMAELGKILLGIYNDTRDENA